MKSFSAILFLLAFICNSSAQSLTPIQFNDRLSAITDSLYAKGTEWGDVLNTAYETKNYSMLQPKRVAIETYIKNEISRVSKMDDVKGSEDLRKAMLDMLVFEKKMCATGFYPFEKLTSSSSKQEVSDQLDKIKAMAEEEKQVLAKVSEAQTAYAAKNGFKIEGAE